MTTMERAGAGLGVRKADPNEIRAVGASLASAFFDDPVIGWAWPVWERRAMILADFFELMASGSLEYEEVYTVDGCGAAALWVPPEGLESSESEETAFFGAVEGVTHECFPAVRTLFGVLDERHPREPHYYLPVVGTRPELRGRGVGTALLAPVLERCDREGMPAYLEATSERNAALYARLGFRGAGRIRLPDGPELRPMWREPR